MTSSLPFDFERTGAEDPSILRIRRNQAPKFLFGDHTKYSYAHPLNFILVRFQGQTNPELWGLSQSLCSEIWASQCEPLHRFGQRTV